MEVVVKFFASAAEAVGERQRRVPLGPTATVSLLLDALCRDCSRLAKMRLAIRVAVNHEYADESQALSNGDEVAIIPPVSGGR